MANGSARELGNLLISRGLIDSGQLQMALQEAEKNKKFLPQVIVDMELAAKDDIYEAIAEEAGVPYVDLSNYIIDPDVLELIPKEIALKNCILPIFKIEERLTIAIYDPFDYETLDQVALECNCDVEVCVSAKSDIERAIEFNYSDTAPVEDMIQQMELDQAATTSEGKEAAPMPILSTGAETPIAKLVDLIITQAVRDRASDIHIEPEADKTRIRFRIDGILYEIPAPPKHLELAIISRVKVLADMDIATTRIPQDGHFETKTDSKIIDTRVSTIPTVYGENLVIRLLATSDVLYGLDQLGFSGDNLEKFEEIIAKPYGIILVTGPTGSGKTTTLYAALSKINSVDKNIITIEDPVEYKLDIIRQIQINPKAGISFANGLRSILRQDPDVIMVGEIRDLDTAEIAIQAALTGHLVFSTLHTNDAPGAVTRLTDMGIAPFLTSASVNAVIAQRLIRQLCNECKVPYKPTSAMLHNLGLDTAEKGDMKFFKGKGCRVCKGTGYSGRVALFEIMIMSDEIRELMVSNATAAAIRHTAVNLGMKSLSEDGFEKVIEGVTSVEEVSRVTEVKVDVGRPEEIVKEEIAAEEPAEVERKAPPATKTVDLNEYRKRIASWLSAR